VKLDFRIIGALLCDLGEIDAYNRQVSSVHLFRFLGCADRQGTARTAVEPSTRPQCATFDYDRTVWRRC
jgi:hypothetical protein